MGYEVQQTRWDRLVRRVSGSIGPGSRVSETLSELFPMLDVEQVPAELLVLGGTRMAVGFSSEAAVAAVHQISELFNPVGSGALLTLHTVIVNSASATGVTMGLSTGAFTNNNSTIGFADGRLLPPAIPVGQVRDETAGARGTNNFFYGRDAYLGNIFSPPHAIAVLSPGTGWSIGTTAVNVSLTVSYMWTERPAEESELSL